MSKLVKIGRFVMRKSMFIVGLIAVFTLIVALIIQIFTSYYIYNYQGNIPSDYRVAVVFGAKVQANGQPTRFLKDRLDAAIRLYKEDQVDVILLSGEKLHENFNEIDVMEKYLLDRGVKIEDTYLDGAGLDTYSTIYRTKNIYQFDKVILISQSYHLKRALFLGKVFGLDCIGYNADSGPYKTEGKQSFREILANIKALLDIGNERAPEVIIAPKK
ncbi:MULTISPECIES: SanA/YdcF family protein [Empedobacter]|uniref:YdcF family protein n=2 Tax=Empedobacter falsenii TaxID=343874 RepID=A0AAW7DCQ6_9FLAO|nr:MULTISPECIES: ElyC/SanA/YdcF family protein [Empedobacter]MDH1882285.1 YdcF family protein [Empedobacter sp. GD03797]MDM1042062.1 YdcF family protein [Empedobacter brevis]MDM1136063.1 YdcF family protein [Empedobacter sp. R750]MDM1549655.1 YdcF family protein [Empedobacter falsenii]